MNKLGNEYEMKYVTKVSFRNIPMAEFERKIPSFLAWVTEILAKRIYVIHIERNI